MVMYSWQVALHIEPRKSGCCVQTQISFSLHLLFTQLELRRLFLDMLLNKISTYINNYIKILKIIPKFSFRLF